MACSRSTWCAPARPVTSPPSNSTTHSAKSPPPGNSSNASRPCNAIRRIAAPLPQLAYSWDGLLPLDLVRTRPPGHFTTIEFDDPLSEIAATWQLLQRLAPL
ncbi:hypothetical protein [Candidatus Amarolinea dominans]|uniref:hypothetical protein n=1 Tax=Candidatus Amarolinea dominans TaxID=3140696 RepID=UPI0031CCC96C